MNPSTRIFLAVVATQAKGIVESQRRIVIAFDRWLQEQDDLPAESTMPRRSSSLRELQ